MGCRLQENPKHMFIAFFEVAAPADKTSAANIVSQFPADFHDVGVTKELPKFCFPCDLSKYNPAGQLFTFVLTGLDHKQRFGFCRHPPGAKKCLCILSYLPWFEIFYKILNQLGELKHHDHNDVSEELVTKLYEADVPSALKQFEINIPGEVSVEIKFIVPDSKALPRINENRNLMEYFSAVNHTNMMILFVSLLYERRILITSDKLSRLTACVHGAASLLYPLYWQHIYIPVMPAHLIDYCCAPMPFLVGVHSSFMPQVRKMALDEVVILNADTNSLETPFEDLHNLPSEAVSQLKKNLKNTSLFMDDGVARTFLKILVYLLGGYREAFRMKSGNKLYFDREVFVQCRSPHMQPFLEKLLQLQHFTQFIDARLATISSGKPIEDLFEEELEIAKQDGSLSSKKLKETLKTQLTIVKTDGKKILKDVQKNVHQKANPEAVRLMLRQTKDFANKQYFDMKNKLIKTKETEDIDSLRRSTRTDEFMTISLPIVPSSAPTSPTGSPQTSPMSLRSSSDVRRKTTINFPKQRTDNTFGNRPMTVAGMPESASYRERQLPTKSKSYPVMIVEHGGDGMEASGLDDSGSSGMDLMADLDDVLTKIGSNQNHKERTAAAGESKVNDDTPVPKPRRRKVHRDSHVPMQRPLLPPPPIPPRRERPASGGRLIDIAGGAGCDMGRLSVQNALGVDCEDTTLTFGAIQSNNNAHWGGTPPPRSYAQEDLPTNTSAQTLLADYGLHFAGKDAPPARGASSLGVPGLRATCSSPDLQSVTSGGGAPPASSSHQLLVQQPPASTLPDLLSPTTTLLTRQPVMGLPSPTPAPPFHHNVPLQPVVAAENPFSVSLREPKDPFADLVSLQRLGVTCPSSKK